ncbi:MAG: EF-P lysine aminoacylase GenX [Bdellovibrionales bacterium]|nr:EF-P lysine aminoacylase GenX [Bdellovibrionales bacterium]
MEAPLRGRVTAVEALDSGRFRVLVRSESGTREATVQGAPPRLGDVGETRGQGPTPTWATLTPNRLSGARTPFTDRVLHPRRLKALQARDQVEQGIREFFRSREFLETRTPLLVPSPGMEPHIRPMKVAGREAYLPTSPEFAMKRLLAGGLPRIFQLSQAFRDEPLSRTHHPEFTMLEWYRAFAGYEEIMRDTEELVAALCRRVHGSTRFVYQGREIDVTTPWPRLRVRDLFREHLGLELRPDTPRATLAEACADRGHSVSESEDWDDLYFKLWLNHVEGKLPAGRAVFVHRYPPSQAALAVVDSDPDGTPWAKRFEFYAGGLELGNAFEELTDPAEQRARFEKDMALRTRVYGPSFPKSPIDEGFLEALAEGMPPSGGIAVGVDRLVMLLADEPDIDFTLWLPSI